MTSADQTPRLYITITSKTRSARAVLADWAVTRSLWVMTYVGVLVGGGYVVHAGASTGQGMGAHATGLAPPSMAWADLENALLTCYSQWGNHKAGPFPHMYGLGGQEHVHACSTVHCAQHERTSMIWTCAIACSARSKSQTTTDELARNMFLTLARHLLFNTGADRCIILYSASCTSQIMGAPRIRVICCLPLPLVASCHTPNMQVSRNISAEHR